MAKRLRKTKKTAAICEEICERLSTGEPLAQICRDEKMPCPTSVRAWMKKDSKFADGIACAREDGEDCIAADCLTIADDGTNDYMETLDAEGAAKSYRLNGEHVQRSRLRIDTRLKLLAKWNPKKYGDKTTLAGDEYNPVAIAVIERHVIKP